jgi:inorganic pyrophosphatase
MRYTGRLALLFVFILIYSCGGSGTGNLLEDHPAINENGSINAVIEIPAGTNEKWELNKESGKLEWERVDGKNRIVDYLGYPGNYGFIPQTLLDRESGGDGDPLDVLVIGPPEERGTVISCKLLGILYLTDRGEQDDKLIAVSERSTLIGLNNIADLDSLYPGITEIIRKWFANYKGEGLTISGGYGGSREAAVLLNKAISAYKSK